MNQSTFFFGLNMNGHLILGRSELEILLNKDYIKEFKNFLN